MSRRPVPPLHLVTDDRVLDAPGFMDRAARALGAGGARVALHLRGPRTEGRRLCELGGQLAALASTHGALFIVNDRVDVALLVGADGAHLGARSLPARLAHRILSEKGGVPILGRSVHGRAEVEALPTDDVDRLDYLFVGTIFPTPSHPGRSRAGPEAVRAVRAVAGELPLIGIGGISASRVTEVTEAGASGVAVLREVWDADDPAAAVERLLEALE